MAALAACASPPQAPTRTAPPPASPQVQDRRCAPVWSAAFDAPMPERGVNAALLDAALLIEANRARCEAGLPRLAPDPALTEVATNHAAQMAKTRLLRHAGGPFSDIVTRLNRANAAYGYAGENLFRYQRYAIDPARPVYTLDRRRCLFSYIWKGPAIPVHSYRTLAEALMEGWIASPDHARNLYNPKFRRTGAGGAIQRDTPTCGDVFAAQVYTG